VGESAWGSGGVGEWPGAACLCEQQVLVSDNRHMETIHSTKVRACDRACAGECRWVGVGVGDWVGVSG
jgi:hypothetical protein